MKRPMVAINSPQSEQDAGAGEVAQGPRPGNACMPSAVGTARPPANPNVGAAPAPQGYVARYAGRRSLVTAQARRANTRFAPRGQVGRLGAAVWHETCLLHTVGTATLAAKEWGTAQGQQLGAGRASS